MLQDFQKFIMKGNVLDLAVAVIIGGAFKTVVNSFVNDILMPPIGIALGGVDFKDLKYVLKSATETIESVTINYGMFIQSIIDFLIIAASIFVMVKVYENMQKKEEAAPKAPPKSETLLEEIRDLLKKK